MELWSTNQLEIFLFQSRHSIWEFSYNDYFSLRVDHGSEVPNIGLQTKMRLPIQSQFFCYLFIDKPSCFQKLLYLILFSTFLSSFLYIQVYRNKLLPKLTSLSHIISLRYTRTIVRVNVFRQFDSIRQNNSQTR